MIGKLFNINKLTTIVQYDIVELNMYKDLKSYKQAHLLETVSRGQTIQYGSPSNLRFENWMIEAALVSLWYLSTLWLTAQRGIKKDNVGVNNTVSNRKLWAGKNKKIKIVQIIYLHHKKLWSHGNLQLMTSNQHMEFPLLKDYY